jgi:hypothetical protein
MSVKPSNFPADMILMLFDAYGDNELCFAPDS